MVTVLLLAVVLGAVGAVWRVGWEAAAAIDPHVVPRHQWQRTALGRSLGLTPALAATPHRGVRCTRTPRLVD